MEQVTPPRAEARTQSSSRGVARESSLPGDVAVPVEDAETLLALVADGGEEKTDPWAEGASLLDLTREEWRLVRNAPLVGFLLVAGADGTVLPRQRRALVSALEQGKHCSSAVFQAVCRELYRQHDTLMELFVSDTFEREQLSEAYRLVVRKLGQDEADRFRACLLKLGRQVALASGSLLASWGWPRAVERRALAELAVALGASAR